MGHSPRTRAAYFSRSLSTMRSGYKKSLTAVPSRRNSGLEATSNNLPGAPFSNITLRTPVAGVYRHCTFADDDFVTLDRAGDFAGYRFHIGKVGLTVARRRGTYCNEHGFARGHRVVKCI